MSPSERRDYSTRASSGAHRGAAASRESSKSACTKGREEARMAFGKSANKESLFLMRKPFVQYETSPCQPASEWKASVCCRVGGERWGQPGGGSRRSGAPRTCLIRSGGGRMRGGSRSSGGGVARTTHQWHQPVGRWRWGEIGERVGGAMTRPWQTRPMTYEMPVATGPDI